MEDLGTHRERHLGGVQSVHRALDVLEAIASAGGRSTIADLAVATYLPLPTAHRLLRTLTERGYVRQLPDRRYALGFRLVPLGAVANVLVGDNADEILAGLVRALGETANLAVLSGTHAEYVAQAPSRFSMRMFTEVGRRVELHSTGVGKALLSQLDPSRVSEIVRRVGLSAHTPYTITSEQRLLRELEQTRTRGYAVDEQEQELGVRCVAVPVARGPAAFMAVSVSGPTVRMSDDVIEGAVPLLVDAARQLTTP